MKLTKQILQKLIKEEHTKLLKEYFEAAEVLRQLGGNKFIAMTGAKQFVKDDNRHMIGFKIGGGAKNGINYIRITLNGKDLYDMEFMRFRAGKVTTVATAEDVYNDQLQTMFTKYTGMDTHL